MMTVRISLLGVNDKKPCRWAVTPSLILGCCPMTRRIRTKWRVALVVHVEGVQGELEECEGDWHGAVGVRRARHVVIPLRQVEVLRQAPPGTNRQRTR
eukprot:3956083-Pyramimonas_sp.AAC.1